MPRCAEYQQNWPGSQKGGRPAAILISKDVYAKVDEANVVTPARAAEPQEELHAASGRSLPVSYLRFASALTPEPDRRPSR